MPRDPESEQVAAGPLRRQERAFSSLGGYAKAAGQATSGLLGKHTRAGVGWRALGSPHAVGTSVTLDLPDNLCT